MATKATLHSPMFIFLTLHKGREIVNNEDIPCTFKEALRDLSSHEDTSRVLRLNEDGTFEDVSLELAEAWLNELSNYSIEDYANGEDEWPAFIQSHISPLRLEELEAEAIREAKAQRNHIRSYSGAL